MSDDSTTASEPEHAEHATATANEHAPVTVDETAPAVATTPVEPHWAVRARDRAIYLIWNQMMKTEHPAWERFFARRCPHLAGMIAYFGVLSVIPAAFLFISALGLAGALESQGWIVEQLQAAIPGSGATTIVKTVDELRDNSGSLGVVGVAGLIWSTTNFFSCVETGMNIIYGVNNRHFIFQKLWVLFLMFVALVALVLVTLAIAVALPVIDEVNNAAERTFDIPIDQDGWTTIIVSTLFAFSFFLSCYRFMPNTNIATRDVWRGAIIAAVAFEISIHILPTVIGQNRGGVVISAFAGAFIVLVWFYVMAFVMLVGGVYNWWYMEKRRRLNLAENQASAFPPVELPA